MADGQPDMGRSSNPLLRLEAVVEDLPVGFDTLRREARAEGCLFIERLAAEWKSCTTRFDREGEALLAARMNGVLAGIGGLTLEPVVPGAVRMRRFYVRPAFRRSGIGRELVTALLARVPASRLITVNAGRASIRFWASVGFAPDARDGHTHIVEPREAAITDQPVPAASAGISIETKRLRLRPLRDDDLADLLALIGDWEVVRWVSSVPYPYTEADGRDWIAVVRKDHTTGRPRRFAIALKETDRLIGGVGLDGATGDDSEEPALGYWLGRPYWGSGYGREAVAAVLAHGFRTLGFETIRPISIRVTWPRKRFCCTAA
ncbi:MAG TPA: GNAT family N-acetyltransferase [Stellaceae bacterium]|nr:GNAT family N-acetyltransferase [Stellaceae bacterium]